MSTAGTERKRNVRTSLLSWATAIFVPFTFAISPVMAMVLLAEPVLPAPLSSVARLVVFAMSAVAVGVACLQRRSDIVVASNTLALPLLLIGVYPAAFSLLLSAASIPEGQFAAFYLLLCAVVGVLAYRTKGRNSLGIHHTLAIVALVFFVFSASLVTRVYWLHKPYSPEAARAIEKLVDAQSVDIPPGARPDVYHLVLDGMGRPDVLAAEYGLRLDAVLEEFRQLGFQVHKGQGAANYVQTHLSMASMLNMSYLDELNAIQGTSSDRRPLRELIARAKVPTIFKRLGYRVEFVGSGYLSNGSFDEADSCNCPQLWFGDVEESSLQFTPLKFIPVFGIAHRPHYWRSLSVFDVFESSPRASAPMYVFAHAAIPHPPFVVTATGEFSDPGGLPSGGDATMYAGTREAYLNGYRQQAAYALRRALEAARKIVADGERLGRRVAVVIHGDHGPRLGFDSRQPGPESGRTVLPVFLAIRTPPEMPIRTPPLSLVNVYRAMFRDVFGADVVSLPDRGYVSGFRTPYKTIPVERLGLE